MQLDPNQRAVSLGRYILGERLAVGGMGEVYIALQTGPGRYARPLALKLLLSHLTELPAAVEMFLDEARLASGMSHPNVVQIFDVGSHSGRYFIAMELVRGVSLARLITGLEDSGEKLPPELIAYIGRCLCDGLHHAHDLVDPDGKPLGIVHRDVTPHNVIVSRQGDVKLTDFGIAKAQDSSAQTRPGVLKGKLDYLSPEQVGLGKGDRRSDIFSAGVTLFQLATATLPFKRDTDLATLQAIIDAPLPDLSALRPDLPEPLRSAIARATAKNPEDRFANARALRDALPPAPGDAADRLGALVVELCRAPLDDLDAKTAKTAARQIATLDLPVTEPRTTLDGESLSKPRRGSSWAVVVLLLLGMGGAGWWLRQATPVPLPVESPPAVAPAPPVVAESAPPPSEVPGAVPPPPVAPAIRRRATAPPKQARGFLTINSTPWATVSIGNETLGYTPIDAFPVEAGMVEVQLRSKAGKTATRRVKVRPGQTSYLKVDLR